MAYQGELDGLCGPYAIVNAFILCGVSEEWLEEQDIFNISCAAIKGWPNVLWEGTTFGHMKKMLKACTTVVNEAYNGAGDDFRVKIQYPFNKRIPKTNKEYWSRFHEIFPDDDVMCGILGMESPVYHWIAFDKKKTLSVFDSAAKGGFRQIKLADIHAGVYKKKKYVVNRQELIVFRAI